MELVNIPTCSVNIIPSPSPTITTSKGGQSKNMIRKTRRKNKQSLNINKTSRMK